MADPGAIRNAIVTKLGADTALLAQALNGAYYKEAPDGSTRFVIVSLVDGDVVPEFQRRSHEDRRYAVEARFLKSAGGDIAAAAARIDALLDPQPPAGPASLTVAGYTLMLIALEEPIDEVERDAADKSIIWFRRGGIYRVVMSVNA